MTNVLLKNSKAIISQVTKSKPHSKEKLNCDVFFRKKIKNADTENG
jgi:hypothetical protein